MFTKLLPHLKHPYAALIVAITWFGMATMFAIDKDLPITQMIIANAIFTILISAHALKTK